MRHLSARHPYSRITDFYYQIAPVFLRNRKYLDQYSTAPCELDRIRQKMPEDIMKLLDIPLEHCRNFG